jgi:hypothetical protein
MAMGAWPVPDGIRFEPVIEGLDTLADAFANAPRTVADAAERAGRDVLGLLRQAFDKETPVRTGYLLSTEDFSMQGPFNIVEEIGAPYAAPVNARSPFIDRANEDALPAIEQRYEQAMDEVAESFAHGH